VASFTVTQRYLQRERFNQNAFMLMPGGAGIQTSSKEYAYFKSTDGHTNVGPMLPLSTSTVELNRFR
jgi:hypothetical protein